MAPTWVDPIVTYKKVTGGGPKRIYVIHCGIGSNDGNTGMITYGAAGYAAQVAASCLARKTAGFDYAVMQTLTPRGDGCPGSCFMSETNRLAYNAAVMGGFAGIDGVMDFAGQAIMGNPANLPLNNGGVTTYYLSDNIHYTTTGAALLTPIIQSTLKTLLPGVFN
jgi:hypothetical protein